MNAQLLSIPEVAERLSCSPRHVYNLIAAGRLATVDIGMGRVKTRVPEAELGRYEKAHTCARKSA